MAVLQAQLLAPSAGVHVTLSPELQTLTLHPENAAPQEAPRVAELQAQLLAQSAEVAAAERRAELAERQRAQSQRLLAALQVRAFGTSRTLADYIRPHI